MKIVAVVAVFGVFRLCMCLVNGALSLLNRFKPVVVTHTSGACPGSRDYFVNASEETATVLCKEMCLASAEVMCLAQ